MSKVAEFRALIKNYLKVLREKLTEKDKENGNAVLIGKFKAHMKEIEAFVKEVVANFKEYSL